QTNPFRAPSPVQPNKQVENNGLDGARNGLTLEFLTWLGAVVASAASRSSRRLSRPGQLRGAREPFAGAGLGGDVAVGEDEVAAAQDERRPALDLPAFVDRVAGQRLHAGAVDRAP